MSAKKYVHKLVRDKIPEIIERQGKAGKTRTVSEKEFVIALKRKLVEEAQEVMKATQQEIPEELADILEVVKTVSEYYEIPFPVIEKIRKEKKRSRGGFKKRLLLEWITKYPQPSVKSP